MWRSAFFLLLAQPGFGQTVTDDPAQALIRAEAQLAAAGTGRERVAALTSLVQAYEAGLAAIRADLRDVSASEAALTESLQEDRQALVHLIAGLQRIGRTPQPVLNDHPEGRVAAARAGGVLADLAPALTSSTTDLRRALAQLDALRQEQKVALQQLQSGLEAAQSARATLGIAISERGTLPVRFDEDPVQMAVLMASVQTLDAFAAGLREGLPDATLTLPAARDLPLPVIGQVLPDAQQDRPGITISTGPQAIVTTPVDATILFQGPLLDYGKVIILEPSKDVLFILTGMGSMVGQIGQVMPAGAAVGFMSGDPLANDSKLMENTVFEAKETAQTLYLEVREGQSPVDPARWFALE